MTAVAGNVTQLKQNYFDLTDLAFSPTRWLDDNARPREWIVEGLIPKGYVTLLSGDGGKGKSLLAQQLCTAAGTGNDFLGMPTKPIKSFALFCEDDREELERRQGDINRHYGVKMGDLGDLTYLARVGKDNMLARYEWGPESQCTDLMNRLAGYTTRNGCQLAILDTCADVFGGNEIRRDQVRNFIGHLTCWARAMAGGQGGAILLTAHVSNEGISSGSGLSGSRAWSNSCRARSWLTGKKGGTEYERSLTVMKSNYGPSGGKIDLKWQRGVFVRNAPTPPKNYAEPGLPWPE